MFQPKFTEKLLAYLMAPGSFHPIVPEGFADTLVRALAKRTPIFGTIEARRTKIGGNSDVRVAHSFTRIFPVRNGENGEVIEKPKRHGFDVVQNPPTYGPFVGMREFADIEGSIGPRETEWRWRLISAKLFNPEKSALVVETEIFLTDPNECLANCHGAGGTTFLISARRMTYPREVEFNLKKNSFIDPFWPVKLEAVNQNHLIWLTLCLPVFDNRPNRFLSIDQFVADLEANGNADKLLMEAVMKMKAEHCCVDLFNRSILHLTGGRVMNLSVLLNKSDRVQSRMSFRNRQFDFGYHYMRQGLPSRHVLWNPRYLVLK